jgi:hypothetical protein
MTQGTTVQHCCRFSRYKSCTLNLLNMLSLVFTVRFLATDSSQSLAVTSTHALSFSTAFDRRLEFRSTTLSSDLVFDNSPYDTLNFLLTGSPLELFRLPNQLSVIGGFSLYNLVSDLTENKYVS